MSTTLSTMELRSKLGEVLDRTYHRREEFVVERKGRPLAVLVPVAEYENWGNRKDRFARSLERVRERFDDLSPEEIEDLVNEAVTAVRQEKRQAEALQ